MSNLPVTLHHDRWIEMDVIWFDPARDLDPQIDMLLTRLAPLWQSTDGMRGLCFNVGWLIDLVTEWTGRVDQKLPLRSRRTAQWAERSYADLRDLFARIRAGAARIGLPDLKLGVLFVGWAHVVWPPDVKIYDFDSDWYARHPELYGEPKTIIGMPDLWPINRLHADSYPYATWPGGLQEDTYFPDFFGAQWGSLSRFLGVDALHLRDGMTGPMVYTRYGPYGASAPADPTVWQQWTQAVIDLYRACKTGNPDTYLIGYSSGISAVAEWRVGCVDLEALVADGAIDCWIDQTWGGAWQDWWHQLWKGWTFQLANLMSHRVMIEAANAQRKAKGIAPCRHYHVIETWDGWEPWDTLHQVPGKLRWGIWAFNHAAAITPDGPKTTDGSYISWANNRKGQILSEDDVTYLRTHLDMAQESAARLEHVYGPLMVYNRPMMDWLMHHHPDWNASEWIEDQVGLLMKWGVPCLGATRIEWLPDVIDRADGLIVQLPGQLDDRVRDLLLKTDKPTLLVGRADLIDPALLARAGAKVTGELQPKGYYQLCMFSEKVHLATFQPILAEHQDNLINLEIEENGPLVAVIAESKFFTYWQPPDWAEPGNAQFPKYQLGSTFPYATIADFLLDAVPMSIISRPNTWENPTASHIWKSTGNLTFLFGNLETGFLGDSRRSHRTTLWLKESADNVPLNHIILRRIDASNQPDLEPIVGKQRVFKLKVDKESSVVYTLENA
jgi:hypothetical protein